jgi:hypothetical protein
MVGAVSRTMTEYSTPTDERRRTRSGYVNALVGALVMIVFSWIPFAPVVGGAIAGYLEADAPSATRSANSRGLRVGALAGLFAAIPALLVVGFVGSIFTVGWLGVAATGDVALAPGLGIPVVAWVVVGFVIVVSVAYHVGLSALGGWLGAEIATRDDRRLDTTPATDQRRLDDTYDDDSRTASSDPDMDAGTATVDDDTTADAETTDAGAETADAGAETADAGAETADAGAETADAGAETTDADADDADRTERREN